MNDEFKCGFCGKVHTYNTDTDEVENTDVSYLEDSDKGLNLILYYCQECKAVVCIMTEEPNGGNVLISWPGS